MPSAYSLQCPACHQAFLATLTRLETLTTCPHCAFNAPLQHFAHAGARPLGPAAALPMKRRVRPPSAGAILPPSPPSPPHLPEFPNLGSDGPPAPAPHRSPPSRPAIRELSTPVTMRAAAVPGQEALWPGLQTDRPVDPALPQPFPPEPPILPKRQSRAFGSLLALGLILLAATAFVVGNHLTHLDQPLASIPPPFTEEIRRPASDAGVLPTPPSHTPSIDEQLALQQLTLTAPDALQRWFDPATSEEVRLAFLLEGDRHRDEVTAFFARSPALNQVKRYPVFPKILPGLQPVALFQVSTSLNEDGGLARFEPQPDGQLKLDWTLFHETHERSLSSYIGQSDPDTPPQWFEVGLRRSHGLELPGALRGRFHAFDLQASPTGQSRATAYSARELPVGRFLDRQTDWNVVYLARLLLKIEVLDDGDPALIILDCRGAGQSVDSD